MSMKKIETFGTYGWCFALILSASFCFGETADSTEPPKSPTTKSVTPPTADAWQTDYYEAVEKATAEKKMLLVLFYESDKAKTFAAVEKGALDDPEIATLLENYVVLHASLETEIETKSDEKIKLIDHTSFREMKGRQGIAILDFKHEDAPYYQFVVSTFPVLRNQPYTKAKFQAMLELPSGTLTQRTLVWAVRVHPEGPKSTWGNISNFLTGQACSHSQHQARIRLQGHHNWESRFHRITGQLPGGLSASEVCAESWPGEGLVEAAVECVRCWKFSSGHWSKVRKFHPLYGYDMKRGKNGIWYATGIFGEGRLRGVEKAEKATTKR